MRGERWWRLITRGTFIVSVSVQIVPESASAILVDLGQISRDTETQLDWLDLTMTTGLSFQDVESGAGGWVGQGWRHATGIEVCTLFAAYAASPIPCPAESGHAVFPPVGTIDFLASRLGVTGVPSNPLSAGFYDDGDPSDDVGNAYLNENLEFQINSIVVQDNYYSQSLRSPYWGNWMVRSVPEPSSALMLAGGLVGGAALRRRTARRAHPTQVGE